MTRPADLPEGTDLGDPDLYRDDRRFARWGSAAAADAVRWSPPGTAPSGFWSVFSQAACRAVMSPAGPFSSEYGMMIGFDRAHPDKAGGDMLVVADGPHHDRLRGIVLPYLSRAMAQSLRNGVEDEVRRLVGDAVDAGVADVARTLGPLVPAGVVCQILGVPAADRDELIDLTNHAFAGADATYAAMSPSAAHAEIIFYLSELVEQRRRHPGDDLISAIAADPRLSLHDVLLNCDNVVVGGNETTRHALTGCFEALSTVPDLLAGLRADPAAVDTAVEEVLRWTSPAMHVLRVATADVEIAGQRIAAGSAVAAWLPAANRDPRYFTDADTFRPARSPNRHLAFGHGGHHCLGAALARLELRTLLLALAERVERVEVTEPPRRLRSNLVQGYTGLSVHLEPLRNPRTAPVGAVG
ncbi:cytochrome P450 [Jidongwangia harbinensis]|uniref:cytochrome P450 n=1 Tax=Jidongwangia harbinensis TaxID=2878561 RepID=UPI001CDA397B|nr:cytochrome P450 [Jidongwangia harbinensis]MCA2211704.1 cytochrome P450 [Jidongwangia harbinensis]